jgi:hypothetical protein
MSKQNSCEPSEGVCSTDDNDTELELAIALQRIDELEYKVRQYNENYALRKLSDQVGFDSDSDDNDGANDSFPNHSVSIGINTENLSEPEQDPKSPSSQDATIIARLMEDNVRIKQELSVALATSATHAVAIELNDTLRHEVCYFS